MPPDPTRTALIEKAFKEGYQAGAYMGGTLSPEECWEDSNIKREAAALLAGEGLTPETGTVERWAFHPGRGVPCRLTTCTLREFHTHTRAELDAPAPPAEQEPTP